MRLALAFVLLACPACVVNWRVPVFATSLTPADARHLMFWPSDGTGDAWRQAVGTRDIPAFEEAPARSWPLSPVEVDGPIDEAVALVPFDASPEVISRAEELLARARASWPNVATHLRPIDLDYSEARSPRLLYAQLQERAVARDAGRCRAGPRGEPARRV